MTKKDIIGLVAMVFTAGLLFSVYNIARVFWRSRPGWRRRRRRGWIRTGLRVLSWIPLWRKARAELEDPSWGDFWDFLVAAWRLERQEEVVGAHSFAGFLGARAPVIADQGEHILPLGPGLSAIAQELDSQADPAPSPPIGEGDPKGAPPEYIRAAWLNQPRRRSGDAPTKISEGGRRIGGRPPEGGRDE